MHLTKGSKESSGAWIQADKEFLQSYAGRLFAAFHESDKAFRSVVAKFSEFYSKMDNWIADGNVLEVRREWPGVYDIMVKIREDLKLKGSGKARAKVSDAAQTSAQRT